MRNLEISQQSNRPQQKSCSIGRPIKSADTLASGPSSQSTFLMKETQENIPASKFKSPQTLFLQAQSCFCFFCFFSFLVLHSFSGVRTSKCPSGPCGLPNTEEESRLFSLKNIKTTPRNSFHKSCRRTGTRNRHPKTKSLSKNYQRGNQNPDSNLRARSSFRVEVCCGRLVP